MLRLSSRSKIDESDYRERLNTLKVLHSPSASRILAHWLMGMFLVFFVLLFMPWQQNITSSGELTALSPRDRPQTIETPLPGRIQEWYIEEGQYVDSGQVLLVIDEIKDKYFDPQLLERIEEQMQAKERSIQSKDEKVAAYRRQLSALRDGLKFKQAQLYNKVEQQRLKVVSDSNTIQVARIDQTQMERQEQMNQSLYDSGLVPLVRLEAARSNKQATIARLVEAQNRYDASLNQLQIAKIDLNATLAEYMDKISKVESDLSATLADIATSQGDLSKQRNEFANMTIRQEQRTIRAPQNGYIVKALKSGIGETVKENTAILTLMPEKPQKAVALFVKAMNVPLLDVGRHVRLQFDGWPALQFSGWPSVSVGTFGGKVQIIDKVDSDRGNYRILIVPDDKPNDQPWPNELRLGSGVYGWVMLDDVPIWYELWRQLNGFPPSLQSYNDGGNAAEGIRPGLIKSGVGDKK